jgi:hypothetical protein
MPKINYQKAPFPWFGGKSQAAPLVWELLGDVAHYVEPFFGSGAVLLNRPHPCNRPYHSETVCDADGFVVNAWRAIQYHPEEIARHASWPVTELDKYARQIAVLKWRTEQNWELLAGTPEWCDPKIAGWWLWSVCVQIGAFNGEGPWTVDPASGRITKQNNIKLGVSKSRPFLSDNGRGVNRPQLREPGVLSDLPNNEFHPLTMPELIRWFQWLSARLRHVRIVHGDWSRVCTTGAAWTIPVRQGKSPAGVFLDPPYSAEANRDNALYFTDSDTIAQAVREWCKKWGDNPKYRIVLAGFDVEHAELESQGWKVYEWFRPGYLRGGMGNVKRTQSAAPGGQQHRERLWASPHCLTPNSHKKSDTPSLFE